MSPPIAEVIQVGELRTSLEREVAESNSRGIFGLGLWVRSFKLTRPKFERIEVVVESAENDLENAMQLMQGELVRHANEAPDRRSDLSHRDAQQELHWLAALLSLAKAARSYFGARSHRV